MSLIRIALSILILSLGFLGDARADQANEKPAVKSETAWKVGDAVDVDWNNEWYQGVILEVKEKDTYRVHYVGWDKAWDQDVPNSKIRARTADSKKGSKKE